MTPEEKRKEVLDLLARGKIGIDEAVILLDQSVEDEGPVEKGEEDSPLKVDVGPLNEETGDHVLVEEIPASAVSSTSPVKEPRWLRIFVGDLETGKSKVKVNVPFGMVKFGLGMAKIFAPNDYTGNLDEIASMIAEADSGLLVDVQDEDSNEHVRIYFD